MDNRPATTDIEPEAEVPPRDAVLAKIAELEQARLDQIRKLGQVEGAIEGLKIALDTMPPEEKIDA